MKLILAGETFEYDGSTRPMSEALAIEKAYGHKYAQWSADLAAGELEAFCVFAWVIWRREGRDVPYEDILSGVKDFDLEEFLGSVIKARAEAEAEDEEPDPTGSQDPDGTPGTGSDI